MGQGTMGRQRNDTKHRSIMKEELKTQGSGMPSSFLVNSMNSTTSDSTWQLLNFLVLLPSHKQSDLNRTLGLGIAQQAGLGKDLSHMTHPTLPLDLYKPKPSPLLLAMERVRVQVISCNLSNLSPRVNESHSKGRLTANMQEEEGGRKSFGDILK